MKVFPITQEEDMQKAFAIRQKVFVEEQEVAREDEYDEFEKTSHHFLAVTDDGEAMGTARWRMTGEGIKLERFAVLPKFRGNGVGQELVKAVLENIKQSPEAKGKTLYMHAQLPAMSLYARFGFEPDGPQFEECGIQHFKMMLNGIA